MLRLSSWAAVAIRRDASNKGTDVQEVARGMPAEVQAPLHPGLCITHGSSERDHEACFWMALCRRDNPCPIAAIMGRLDLMEYGIENCAWRPMLSAWYAREYNRPQVLEYERTRWMGSDGRTITAAARNGHLNVVKYARARGFRWGKSTTAAAASHGHVHVLAYVRAHGCPWDVSAPAGAARNRHLRTVQYLHEHGCPWDESTTIFAAEKGQIEILKYALAHGCPWDARAAWMAWRNGHRHVLEYLKAHGCPWASEYTIDWLS